MSGKRRLMDIFLRVYGRERHEIDREAERQKEESEARTDALLTAKVEVNVSDLFAQRMDPRRRNGS